MSQHSQFEVNWEPRCVPLRPTAVAAQGEASLRLAQRLLKLDDKCLSQLEGVAGKRLIVVQGVADLLPWVEGVQYFGIDPAAPALLLPTNYQPSLPPPLLARALAIHLNAAGMIALLQYPPVLVPLQSARPVSRQSLASWMERP